jgi:hypothetical protein
VRIEDALDQLANGAGVLTLATVSAAFQVPQGFVARALTLWTDLAGGGLSNTKITSWAYLNLLRYHIATHAEPIDCASSLGGTSDDDSNDIDNLLAGVASWPTVARITGLCFDLKVNRSALLTALQNLDSTLTGPYALRIMPSGGLPEGYPPTLHEVHCWTALGWIADVPELNFWPLPMDGRAEIVQGTLKLRKPIKQRARVRT